MPNSSIPEKVAQFREELLAWGEIHRREFPWRDPDRSLYEIFIAEFFLTQTPAENVARHYESFLEQFPALSAIEAASKSELVQAIEPLGFYNIRAEALLEIANRVDTLPKDAEQLTELPRVGRYVANTTICFATGAPLPVLDRNVKRVYDRIFGTAWPDERSNRLKFTARAVPERHAREYNMALLDFGAIVCKSDPRCRDCFATEYCEFYDDSMT